ncbi:MFS transporter [Paraburkholderia sp. ZP32-5]|uniref:MFS transporter n=1 Tax=Paraburkholderia sp. ZP32-5 TaxID=2883245 RepID=UPI001F3E3DAA|nr:MFS transporter [Paraburkholderia sp. ZP32-5]
MNDARPLDASPASSEATQSDTALQRAVRKNAWRLITFLSLCYLVNFLDRTSVSYAALQMNKAVGLTPTQFGWGAGMLFISYCVFEVPSNLAMYRYGARRWIARIMITWGIAAMAMALTAGPISFYVLRFLLGAFEAGFFPGVIWYISIWFPASYRTRVLAWFAVAAPVSQTLGAPLSVALLRLDGWFGLGGWQWMFILQGLPAVLLGVVALKVLRDTPAGATWLAADERRALLDALASETHDRPKKNLLAACKDIRVVTLAFITFSFTIGSYGIGLWLPLILKGHGLSLSAVGWWSSVAFLAASVATIVAARYVDRSGRRVASLMAAMILATCGLVCAVVFPSFAVTLVCLVLAIAGTIAARTVFYTIPSTFLTGAAAAGGFAAINCIGSLGGFVGPGLFGWLKDLTHSYDAGMLGIAAVLLVGTLLAWSLKLTTRT